MTEGMDFSETMHRAGFHDGDILLSLNGERIDAKDGSVSWDLVQPGSVVEVLRNRTDTVKITVSGDVLKQLAADNQGYMSIRVPVYVDAVVSGEGAAAAGLMEGDRIVKVQSDTTPTLSEFFPALAKAKSTEAQMLIVRNGAVIARSVAVNDNGKIGIQLRQPDKIFTIEEVHYNIFSAIPRGIERGVEQLTSYVSSLKLIFTKEGATSVGGFGTLGSLFPKSWDWYSFWQITALLSVILAFMNIIPIPALDGGYILFLLVEIVTRRKPSDKFIEIANTIGMGFLFLLLIYANANDIYRLFIK